MPHRGQSRLVPIGNNYGKRRREERDTRGDADGDVGLLVGCPAGYGLQNSHCSMFIYLFINYHYLEYTYIFIFINN